MKIEVQYEVIEVLTSRVIEDALSFEQANAIKNTKKDLLLQINEVIKITLVGVSKGTDPDGVLNRVGPTEADAPKISDLRVELANLIGECEVRVQSVKNRVDLQAIKFDELINRVGCLEEQVGSAQDPQPQASGWIFGESFPEPTTDAMCVIRHGNGTYAEVQANWDGRHWADQDQNLVNVICWRPL